mgnify:CR=1 FL=1
MAKALKDLRTSVLIATIAFAFASCGNTNTISDIRIDTAQAPSTELKSIKDSLSWAYGQYLAVALQGEYFDTVFNHDLVLEAFTYTLKGGQHNLCALVRLVDFLAIIQPNEDNWDDSSTHYQRNLYDKFTC